MPLNFRKTFVCGLLPENFPSLLVKSVDLPGVFWIILYGSHITEQPVARLVFGAAGECGRDEDFVAPNNGTRMREARYRGLPASVDGFVRVPFDCRSGPFDDSRGAGAAELRPILCWGDGGGD